MSAACSHIVAGCFILFTHNFYNERLSKANKSLSLYELCMSRDHNWLNCNLTKRDYIYAYACARACFRKCMGNMSWECHDRPHLRGKFILVKLFMRDKVNYVLGVICRFRRYISVPSRLVSPLVRVQEKMKKNILHSK